ncbi:MAG TPA: transglycosylase domain-containing protein, partial [Coleofasciculaceae cyanobacterium]
MSSNALGNQPKQSAVPDTLHQFIKAVTKVTGASVLGITMLTSSIVAGGLVGLAISFRNLPDVRILRSYAPSQTTYIYDMKGKLLASLHGEANRSVVPLDKISPHLKRAVIAIEDSHFYQHTGVNPGAVTRAFIANWTEGRTVEGGSTLTMQLVKNLFLTPKRAFSRKLAESVLATRVEQVFSKNQILEMYLNQVYWGHNTYGAETAAQSYFGKHATDLNLAESALMAGLIQAPENLSPFVNYKLSKQRQKDVLNRMADLKWITPQEADAAYKQPLKFGEITSFRGSQLPYITEAATQELTQRFGKDALIKGGMRVQTTVDSKMQRIAEDTVRWGNQKLNNQGVYADQMALVAVDPRTHYVKAMVGGVDYKKSQYNR